MPMSDEEAVVEQAAIAGIGTKVFGKWDATEVVCNDPGIGPGPDPNSSPAGSRDGNGIL